jgi:glycosyltransferase involved in cell wall biosynthesis
MMVVLQLGAYPPPYGGVQTNLVAIRDYLRLHGISAPVINLTKHRRADSDEVYYPASAAQVLRYLLDIPADIVHVHIGGRLSARLLGLCLICSLIPGRRVVLTFHSGGYPSQTAAHRVRRRSVRGFVFRRLNAVIAVNQEIAAVFRQLGVTPSRIHVICPYTPVVVREDIVLPDNLKSFCGAHSPLLTTVGLLEPEYDLSLQIATLEAVRQKFPRAGLVIIGSGSLESALRHQIASSPARDHVLLCGDVPHPLTVRIISESDVFLRTTFYDGDSVSVREALQLGVPVIASDNGLRPPGVHLIPGCDGAALCHAIQTVLVQPLERRPTFANANNDLDRLLELYSALVGKQVHFCDRAASV